MMPPGAGMGGGMTPEAEALKKSATTWLIVSLVCGGNWISAILFFLAMQAAGQGNVADAQSKMKLGKIIWGVMLALIVLSVGISFLGGFMSYFLARPH